MLDTDRLEQLYVQLGNAGAEDVVCRALEEMAARLSQAERHYTSGSIADLRKGVRGLIAIADQIGMQAVVRVARDVTHCIDEQDGIALAATLARLLRLGEQSLQEMTVLQDYSL